MLKTFMLKKKKINDKFHKETYRTYPISSVQSNPEDLQKNLKETLISVSIKKKSVSQHFGAKLTKSKYSDRNQPEPTKKNRKRNVKNISKNTKKKKNSIPQITL